MIGTPLIRDVSLKFHEDTESKYPTLISIELAILDRCMECKGYYECEDAQRTICEACTNVEPRERVDEELKLVNIKEKKYTFSNGITLTFADSDDTTTFSTCIFERNPMYDAVKLLKKDSMYHVRGWVSSKNDKGLDGIKAIFELEEAPEE